MAAIRKGVIDMPELTDDQKRQANTAYNRARAGVERMKRLEKELPDVTEFAAIRADFEGAQEKLASFLNIEGGEQPNGDAN